MSDVRRIVDLLIDVSSGRRVVAEGDTVLGEANVLQYVYRGDQALFRCKLYVGDQATAFTPATGATWLFGIDKDFTPDQTDLVVSDNDEFIAADWDEADFANGIICWRADFTSAALKAALASTSSMTMYACLWMTPSGGLPTLLAQWQMNVTNIAVDPTTATPQEGIVHATTAMLADYIKKVTDGSPWRWSDSTKCWYCYNPDDELWYPITVRTVGGVAGIVLGEGVAL